MRFQIPMCFHLRIGFLKWKTLFFIRLILFLYFYLARLLPFFQNYYNYSFKNILSKTDVGLYIKYGFLSFFCFMYRAFVEPEQILSKNAFKLQNLNIILMMFELH